MMTQQDDFSRVYSCSQCPKMFATRSNLKRHMENPNIHNIPYIRSRDQKRWKGHAKKIISKEETTERMRKWRAENREKNRQNDLRCRVYRLSRQKFGDQDSVEKQQFIRDEISRRLGRKISIKSSKSASSLSTSSASPSASPSSPYSTTSVFSSSVSPPPNHQHSIQTRGRRYRYSTAFTHNNINEDDDMKDELEDENEENHTWKSTSTLPFYNFPHQKIQLPSIDTLCPPLVSSTNLRRRTSSSSESSISTTDESHPSITTNTSTVISSSGSELTLPPVHTFLYPYQHHPQQQSSSLTATTTNTNTINKHEDNTKILDDFVGVVLDYAQDNGHRSHSRH